jgi:hypothetical protein
MFDGEGGPSAGGGERDRRVWSRWDGRDVYLTRRKHCIGDLCRQMKRVGSLRR